LNQVLHCFHAAFVNCMIVGLSIHLYKQKIWQSLPISMPIRTIHDRSRCGGSPGTDAKSVVNPFLTINRAKIAQ
jgi:hypothetical protein